MSGEDIRPNCKVYLPNDPKGYDAYADPAEPGIVWMMASHDADGDSFHLHAFEVKAEWRVEPKA